MKLKLKDKIFTYRFATEKDIDILNRFDINIYKKVNPDFYFRHTKKMLKNMMSCGRKIWVVFYKDKLVAWAGMGLQINKEEAKNYYLTEKQIEKAAVLLAAAVSPRFRGYGLQRFLINKRIEYFKKIKLKYALINVNPSNKISEKNIKDCGFTFTKKARSKRRKNKIVLNHYFLKL